MRENNAEKKDTSEDSPPAKAGKNVIKQLVTRGFTILVLAPTVFYLISVSRMAMVAIVYVVICFCSFEWSGVKRHLKVAVLLAKNHRLHTSVDGLGWHDAEREKTPHTEEGEWKWRSLATEQRVGNLPEDSPSWVSVSEKEANDLGKTLNTSVCLSQVGSVASTTEGIVCEEPKGAIEGEVELRDTPFLNASVKEFAYPVPTLTIYNVCKHLSWANFAIAASQGSLTFLVLFCAFFLIFVGVTIIAHNRLEFKVEEAMDRLLELRAMSTLRYSASDLISGKGSFLSGSSSVSRVVSPLPDPKGHTEGNDPHFLETRDVYLQPVDSNGCGSSSTGGSGKNEETTMGEKGTPNRPLPSTPVLQEDDTTASTMRHRGEADKREGNDHRSKAIVDRGSLSRQERGGGGGAASLSASVRVMPSAPGVPPTYMNVSLPLPPSLFPSFSLSGFFNREKRLQEKARKDQAKFARLELLAIVENQPAEQFVDFCLDIFGCVWISLFATVIMVYDIPFLGFPWVCAALAGNFANDIMALVVGMTVKAIKRRFFSPLKDVPSPASKERGELSRGPRRSSANAMHSEKPLPERPREGRSSERNVIIELDVPPPQMGGGEEENDPARPEGRAGAANAAERARDDHPQPLSTTTTTKVPGGHSSSSPTATCRSWWSGVEDFMAQAPHPLYLSISPNKSVEGALAGVLSNTIVFALVLSLWPWGDTAYSSSDHAYYYRYETIDHPMTAPMGMDVLTGLRGSTALAFPCPRTLKGAESWPLSSSCVRVPRYHCFSAWVVAGLIMGVAGVVGDLMQSLLKRVSRVKDTGSLLPGHGGMLDRVDGLLLSFPTLFCLIYAVIALG